MTISAIIPQQKSPKKPFTFLVRFDDDTQVEVPAGALRSYSAFQSAVLSRTGRHWRSHCLEALCKPRDRAEWWQRHLAAGLALGRGERPVLRFSCFCFARQGKPASAAQSPLPEAMECES